MISLLESEREHGFRPVPVAGEQFRLVTKVHHQKQIIDTASRARKIKVE
jgi:hypothetical protein